MTYVQSVVFRKPYWTHRTAVEWLAQHKFKKFSVDEKVNTLRYRQKTPRKDHRYRTVTLRPDQILLILGFPDR